MLHASDKLRQNKNSMGHIYRNTSYRCFCILFVWQLALATCIHTAIEEGERSQGPPSCLEPTTPVLEVPLSSQVTILHYYALAHLVMHRLICASTFCALLVSHLGLLYFVNASVIFYILKHVYVYIEKLRSVYKWINKWHMLTMK